VTNPRPLTPPYVPLLLPSRLGAFTLEIITLCRAYKNSSTDLAVVYAANLNMFYLKRIWGVLKVRFIC